MTTKSGLTSRRAYLLQCWRERAATLTQKAVWRFAIEKIEHARHPPQGFASLEALVAFLQQELWDEESPEPAGDK